MKNRVIGILIFLFFMAVPFLFEGGKILSMFMHPSPLIIVFGPAAGLTVAHFRKGMNRQTVLKRAKRYLIYCGFLGTILALISVSGSTSPESMASSVIFTRFAYCLIPSFFGLLTAYIIDTFIDD